TIPSDRLGPKLVVRWRIAPVWGRGLADDPLGAAGEREDEKERAEPVSCASPSVPFRLSASSCDRLHQQLTTEAWRRRCLVEAAPQLLKFAKVKRVPSSPPICSKACWRPE